MPSTTPMQQSGPQGGSKVASQAGGAQVGAQTGVKRIRRPPPTPVFHVQPASLLLAWQVTFAGFFIGQLLLPSRLAAMTVWGNGAGWQRELAFWNLGGALLAGAARKSRSETVAQGMVTAFSALSALLAFNHAIALLSGAQWPLHWMGVLFYGAMAALGALTRVRRA